MDKLALVGGSPVTENLVGDSQLTFFPDLERRYLVEAHESGVWDDWPDKPGMAHRFADEWAAFCDSGFCVLSTNGTHTLQLSLEALGIGSGDEVIVPGLTWQATASVVCDVNAVPVLVDVDPDTLCIDVNAAANAVTARTRAIIPVHLYHRLADMDAVATLASKHGLAIIEDCAHVHGSTWKGRSVGSLGHVGSFSFQSSKLVNSGEGGAIVTDSEDVYRSAVSLRTCGRPFENNRIHSGNFRITSFQAAVLLGQLQALKENMDAMDRNGRALDAAVEAAPGVRPLVRDDRITRQCSFGFIFLYDQEAFGGLDVAVFRKALSAELGYEFWNIFEPLNSSEVYYPHTKPRHQLSDEYVQSIRPARWELPTAQRIRNRAAVNAYWPILGCRPERAKLLTEAIERIHSNRGQLLRLNKEEVLQQ